MPAHSLKLNGLTRAFLPEPTDPVAAARVRVPARARLEIEPRLLARCRAGDPQAFDVLFERTRDHVYTLALHFSGDEAVAADVTQEVYLKLLDRIGQFREDATFSTWLYRIVLNTFLDERRRRRPWLSLDGPEEAEDPLPELTLAAPQEDAVARSQTAAGVRRAVASLAPHLRALVVLRYSAGLPYEEIATVLGISPGTVASRLNRVHRKLAKKLVHLRPAAQRA